MGEETQRATSLEHIHDLYTQLTPRHRVIMWSAWLLLLTNKRLRKPFHYINFIWRRIVHHVD